jgi:molecular chaperone DnaK
MSTAIGIDLGTTNSVITHLEGGRAVAVDIDGSPVVPSVVMFEPGGRVVVGREARNLELSFPERTVRSAKRKMGTDHVYTIDDRHLKPEEIGAEVLKHLKRGAEAALGQPVGQAVITVPAYFDDAQRKATLRAGELAGLEVLRLINEPTSASLVYEQVDALAPSGLVMIYDLGGGTFDVSILEVFEGIREVKATAGNTQLGGDDFDEKLLGRMHDWLKTHEMVDVRDDPRAMARLRRVAEQAKITLSSETSVHVREEFLAKAGERAVHLDLTITRREFEDLIEPLLTSTVDLCKRAVADAGVDPSKIARICLVGGSTRIPKVRELLAETYVAEVHEEIDPDLAVALGAAVQAGLLLDVPVDRILVDVASHSLGILVEDDGSLYVRSKPDTFAPVLRRNTVLPATRTEEFYTSSHDQPRVLIEVFQGESTKASQNTYLGEFRLDLEPAPEGAPIRVEFSYDLNGVVKVEAEQVGKGRKQQVELKVSDVHKSSSSQATEPSALERRVRKLLEELPAEEKPPVEALLTRLRQATDVDRGEIEDELLNVLLEHESDED